MHQVGRKNTIHVIFFLIFLDKLSVCTHNHEYVEYDIIDILTSEVMENMPPIRHPFVDVVFYWYECCLWCIFQY